MLWYNIFTRRITYIWYVCFNVPSAQCHALCPPLLLPSFRSKAAAVAKYAIYRSPNWYARIGKFRRQTADMQKLALNIVGTFPLRSTKPN